MSCPQNDAECGLAVEGLGVPDARMMHGRCTDGVPERWNPENSDVPAILVTWRYNYPPFMACVLTSRVHILSLYMTGIK